MAGRTVFVNPSAFGRKRRRRSGKRRRRNVSIAANPRRRYRRRARRRNAGITPFVSNPMIMANPRRRRRRNPLSSLNFSNILGKSLSYGGGAAIAVAANALVINRVENVWARNAARVLGAVLGGAMLGGELGAATAGGMFYPLMQELSAQLLGQTAGASGTEADMDVLAADLEDIMDELDSSDLQDDDETGDDGDDIGDDGDILFG